MRGRRVAVITGAGSGIGRAAAIALARKDYALVLAGRQLAPLEETAALCAGGAIALATDVICEISVTRLFEQAVSHFGRVDLLFSNAGVGGGDVLLEDLTLESWSRVININLTGTFICLRAAFRVMKSQIPPGGRIINNGSVSAFSPRPNSPAYTAAKHAITGLTKSASLDGRKYNIACCQIDIGNASSALGNRMTEGVLQANGDIAAEPVMNVTHVGEAICYMDSLPLDANVPFMTLMATAMPLFGRG